MNEEELLTTEQKRKLLEKLGRKIVERAIQLAPIDNGELRRSIGYEVEGDILTVYAKAEQAQAMEYGEPPGELTQADKQDLRKWSERHKANPGKIINYIKKKGIVVGTPENPIHITSYKRDSWRPFLRPAFHQRLAEIQEILIE